MSQPPFMINSSTGAYNMDLGDIDQFREDVREGKAVEALENFFNNY